MLPSEVYFIVDDEHRRPNYEANAPYYSLKDAEETIENLLDVNCLNQPGDWKVVRFVEVVEEDFSGVQQAVKQYIKDREAGIPRDPTKLDMGDALAMAKQIFSYRGRR